MLAFLSQSVHSLHVRPLHRSISCRPLRRLVFHNRRTSATLQTPPDRPSLSRVGLALSTVAAFAAGGRILPVWSALFLFLSRISNTPPWLVVFSALFCSAISDSILISVLGGPLDRIFLPFALFAAGSFVSAVSDFDAFFHTDTPGAHTLSSLENNSVSTGVMLSQSDVKEEIIDEGNDTSEKEFSAWDDRLDKTTNQSFNDDVQ